MLISTVHWRTKGYQIQRNDLLPLDSINHDLNVNTLDKCRSFWLITNSDVWIFLPCVKQRCSCVFKKFTMSKTKFTINSNGSVKVEGDFEIVDTYGNVYGLQGRTIVSLCRCGRSSNKPFCDGSHKEHFEHDAKAFDLPPKKV